MWELVGVAFRRSFRPLPFPPFPLLALRPHLACLALPAFLLSLRGVMISDARFPSVLGSDGGPGKEEAWEEEKIRAKKSRSIFQDHRLRNNVPFPLTASSSRVYRHYWRLPSLDRLFPESYSSRAVSGS